MFVLMRRHNGWTQFDQGRCSWNAGRSPSRASFAGQRQAVWHLRMLHRSFVSTVVIDIIYILILRANSVFGEGSDGYRHHPPNVWSRTGLWLTSRWINTIRLSRLIWSLSTPKAGPSSSTSGLFVRSLRTHRLALRAYLNVH
jgi:hypothetical protein